MLPIRRNRHNIWGDILRILMLIVRDGWLAQHQLFGLPYIHSIYYHNIAQLGF